MIEGQEDVTWDDWTALARACEDGGLAGLFRSDHYVSVAGDRSRGSLDAWATLTALAAVTSRIRLGTLVSPATFRHPSEIAKVVTTADHVSGGRVELGLGAGWHELEHTSYGFPFPATGERMQLLAEQLEIVHRQWSEASVDFEGSHYRLTDCRALPGPVQTPHPTLIVGGLAGPRSADLAGRWADEYNTVFATPEEAQRRRSVVVDAWKREGRDPDTLRFSVMLGAVVGETPDDVAERLRALAALGGEDDIDPDEVARDRRGSGWIVGTVDEAVEHLERLRDAGVDRVMLQHLLHRDLDMVALLGRLAAVVG